MINALRVGYSVLRYRGGIGQWAWAVNRVAGLGILLTFPIAKGFGAATSSVFAVFKVSSGTVLLQVDWTTDVEAVRKELARVLATEGKDLWDGKLAKVQVVDSTEQTMQLRILLGGFVDTLFDLRSLVRERLIAFVHRTPEWLPRQRVQPPSNAQAQAPASPAPAPTA